VTVHAPTSMTIIWDAGRKLPDVVEHAIGARPIGVEVIAEADFFGVLMSRRWQSWYPRLR
jgi:hypothetical protein